MQQKVALEECKIKTDRQVGRVQSKEGHEWQARCILYPAGKRELLRGWWQGGQGSFRKRSLELRLVTTVRKTGRQTGGSSKIL